MTKQALFCLSIEIYIIHFLPFSQKMFRKKLSINKLNSTHGQNWASRTKCGRVLNSWCSYACKLHNTLTQKLRTQPREHLGYLSWPHATQRNIKKETLSITVLDTVFMLSVAKSPLRQLWHSPLYLNSGVGLNNPTKILLKHRLVKAVQMLRNNLVLASILINVWPLPLTVEQNKLVS
jgi:hypothetical protein